MNYEAQTGKSIDESFAEFHAANPHVYEAFKAKLREVVQAGKRKTSAKLIINVLRWNEYMQTKSNDGFKLNDAYSSRYARLFISENPSYEYLFETRELRSN